MRREIDRLLGELSGILKEERKGKIDACCLLYCCGVAAVTDCQKREERKGVTHFLLVKYQSLAARIQIVTDQKDVLGLLY
jgi:hypothetical protein